MDTRFLPHNSHWEQGALFSERDPHLRHLAKLAFVYVSPLLNSLPNDRAGIYTLTGGRQVGKTTFFKQWMEHLLRNRNVPPQSLAFLTGELIDDHHSLVRTFQDLLAEMTPKGLRYVIVDEVTYIRDWDKGVKYLADAGLMEKVALFITGSDAVVIEDARKRFPGRRGTASQVDFHFFPLTFRETLDLKKIEAEKAGQVHWEEYLLHGGFLPALNDFGQEGTIRMSTLATYSDWIRGDVLKRRKTETYLREFLGAMIARLASQITWGGLASTLSIDHHQTVADYAFLLEKMDAIIVQPALMEDKLQAAPKKAKKLHFCDPFIFHALRQWLEPVAEPFMDCMVSAVHDPVLSSHLTEGAVVSHYRRQHPTYYIKAEGEVDIAYVKGNRFYPIEVKWTEQIRPANVKQARKYANALLLGKLDGPSHVHNIRYENLVRHMRELSSLPS